MDPTQTRKANEALMCDVNTEARYVSTKYSVQIPFVF